jgi:hypothetical protein
MLLLALLRVCLILESRRMLVRHLCQDRPLARLQVQWGFSSLHPCRNANYFWIINPNAKHR